MLQSLVSDLHYAARELRRRPAFTATAVLSLALGVGATSAVFSVVYAVLLNPFPYAGSNRITQVSLIDKPGNNGAQGTVDHRLNGCVRSRRSKAWSRKTDGISPPPTATSRKT